MKFTEQDANNLRKVLVARIPNYLKNRVNEISDVKEAQQRAIDLNKKHKTRLTGRIDFGYCLSASRLLCSILRKYGFNAEVKFVAIFVANETAQKIIMENGGEITSEQFSYNIIHGDSRDPSIFKEIKSRFDFSIFSPPYANCFDYTEVYKLELWTLGFIKEYADLKILRAQTLSSHLNKKYTEKTGIPEISKILEEIKGEKMRLMLSNYFFDMKQIFQNVKEVLAGSLHCIVANSCYNLVPIATDLIFTRLLEDLDYTIERIEIVRKMHTSSQQSSLVGKDGKWLRESIVVASVK